MDGAPPGTAELADSLDVTSSELASGLRRLADERHLFLHADGVIVTAHPFPAVPMGFSVMGDHTLW